MDLAAVAPEKPTTDWFGLVMLALAVAVIVVPAFDIAFLPQTRSGPCVPGSAFFVVLAACIAGAPVFLISLFGIIFCSRRKLLVIAAGLLLLPALIGLLLLSMRGH